MRHTTYWPWRYAFAAKSCHHSETCSRRGSSVHESRWHHRGGGGRDFGVRRPLRFLAFKLDLSEPQTRRMAAILNQLKAEREQAQLDEKRTVSALGF